MTPVLTVKGACVAYGGTEALDHVSFEVGERALAGIVGPNGAGKSTLLKAILGLVRLDAGEVTVSGLRGGLARRELVYVPQRSAVDWDFPITVEDVVSQGRYGAVGLLRRFSAEDRQRVARSLELMGLTDLKARQIGELSGGQQQRTFLARALAQDGSLYLMDEPFAGIDAATEQAIVTALRELRDSGKSVLVVHHDLSTVRRYFDTLLLLNRRVIATGPSQAVFTRANLAQTYGGQLAVLDEGGAVVVS